MLLENETKLERKEKSVVVYSKNKNSWIIISGLSSVVAFLGYTHFRNKKRNKQKFEAIMNKDKQAAKPVHKEYDIDIDSEINPEIVKSILQNLEKLEKEEYDLVKPYLNYDGKGEVTLSDLKALSTLASEKKGTDNKWDTAEQKSFLNSLSIKSIFSTIL